MYSFASEPRTKALRIIELMTLEQWERYPYARQVGVTYEPANIRDLMDANPEDLPHRVLLRQQVGRRTKYHLLEKTASTIEYDLIMTLDDQQLAERLVRRK